MARLTSQLILSLIDRVSAPARRATQSLRGITRAVTEGNGQRLRAMADAQRQTVAQLRGDLVDTGAAALALGAAFGIPIRKAREFEAVLEDIAQKAPELRKQQLQLGASFRALGPEVNRSAQEIARGADILAGLGVQDPAGLVAMMRPIGKAATAYRAEIEDLANAGYAATSNLKIPFEDTQRALAIMAVAGKEGAFELKDMARYFPSLTASAQALGQTGAPAVADLAAALQITRKGAGDAEEAATNLSNVLQKINAPLTRKKFAKFGVDLEASMKAAAAKGMTPIEAIAEITNRTLKGDLNKLGDLFEDAQVQKGLRPLIQNLELYREIRAKAGGATAAVVDQDFLDRMKTGAARADAFRAKIQNLAISFGTALLPGLNSFLDLIGPIAGGVASLAERFPGLTRLVVGATAAIVALRLATLAFRFGKAQMLLALTDLGLGLVNFRTLATGAVTAARRNVAGGLMAMALQTRTATGIMALSIRGLLAASGIGLLLLAAGWIVQHWSGVVSFFRGFGQGFMAAIAPVRPALEPLIQGVKTVVGWVRQLLGDKGEDWTSWGVKAGTAVGGFVTGAIKFLGDLVGWFKRALDLAWQLAKWTPAGLVIQGGAAVARAVSGGGRKPAGKRAGGGDVRQGLDYLVGERGPEIFRAPASGRVYPNGQRPSGSGAVRGRAGGVFAPRIQILGAGQNAEQIAEMVMARLRAEYERFAAGSHADGGVFA